MDDDPTPIITKRRRTSKNCVACRKSKVKCDRKIPCTRCSKLRVPCQYFEVPKDPNAEKLEELQIEIAHLKSLLSSRAEVNQQATPTESLHTSIAQTNPFDQIIAQHQSPLQSDAALENADLLSAHFSGGSSITTSSWHGVARDFALSQSLPGDPPIIHQAYRQESPRCGHNDSFHGSSTFYIRQSPLPDAVVCRVAAPGDAERWFNCFFEGSDRLIPVFSNADTYTSVRQRSSLLFDVILTVGCKIYCGSNSAQYQSMHHHLRQRISTYVLSSLMIHSVETVQALLVLACYWEKSWLFMDLALWMTQELKLPDAVEQMMTRMAGEGPSYLSSSGDLSVHDKALFQMARVCCGVYVLDKIFSLDGGKTSGIASSPNPRRLRCLLNHPSRSAIDFRLLSQVELNSLRAHIHATLTPPSPASTAAAATTTITTTAIPDTLPDPHVATTLRNARLDLALWLSDWTALARAELGRGGGGGGGGGGSGDAPAADGADASEHALNVVNLQIQYQWALINAHLKALSALGVQNIAVVTDAQRAVVLAAKKAAEAHMRLLLAPAELPGGGFVGEGRSDGVSGRGRGQEGELEEHEGEEEEVREASPYLACFRWATTFVWAKLAFSVLLTLRLALLLGDPVERLVELGTEARRVARELRRVTEGRGGRVNSEMKGGGEEGQRGGQAEYFSILETSVEKFQMAVGARVRGDADADRGRGPVGGVAGSEQRGVGVVGGRGSVGGGGAGSERGEGTEAEADFRTYLPKEFSFDWDFPGLNLQYIPLDWEELFGNFDEIL